jgi:hypothetical protein
LFGDLVDLLQIARVVLSVLVTERLDHTRLARPS